MPTLLEQLVKQNNLYAKQLNSIGRRWFTKNIIQHAQVTHPGSVEAEARSLLQRARSLVVARLATTRGSLADDLKRPEQNEIRARIVYGVLGSNPGIFLEGTGQNGLLDFIVERRFRSIQRMLSFINPNRTRQIMAYPPSGPLSAQVSTQTRTLWEGVNTISGNKHYPFLLTAQGKVNPKDAIEKLFEKNTDLNDRTRVDCPAAAMCVHLDSLMVANNPARLATQLAGVSNDHFAIDHAYGPWRVIGGQLAGGFLGIVSRPATAGANVDVKMLGVPRTLVPFDIDIVDKDGRQTVRVTNITRDTPLAEDQVLIESSPLTESTLRVTQLGRAVPVGAYLVESGVPNFHAVNDPRPDNSFFEQSFISENEIQVGDHIYVANHPFHRSRLSSTIWNGEHAFVVDPWQGSRKMLVTGHGVTKLSVAGVVWNMLEEINAFLEITRKMVDAWLAIPSSATPVQEITADNNVRAELGRFLLLPIPLPFNGTLRAFNLPAVAYHKNEKDKTYPSSWIFELDGTLGIAAEPFDRKRALFFDYDPERKTANPWPPASSDRTNRIAVLRHPDLVAAGGAAKLHYTVSYIEDFAGVLVHMPLYNPAGPRRGKPVRLSFNDIQDSVVMGTAPDKVFVVKPRVQSTATYLAFLRNIGAIV